MCADENITENAVEVLRTWWRDPIEIVERTYIPAVLPVDDWEGSMVRLLPHLTMIAATVIVVGAASSAGAVERIRGTIKSVEGDTLNITANAGDEIPLKLETTTGFASVVPASLSDIKPGSFVGTATKEANDHSLALEVVVFPEAMRGRGEGHYAWDMMPDIVPGADGRPVQSTMTEGTVARSAAPRVKSMMTNGTVGSTAPRDGMIELNVSYGGGKSIAITVPSNVPVVTFVPADRSALKPGAKVFVVADGEAGKMTAKVVNVGKDGLTPPM